MLMKSPLAGVACTFHHASEASRIVLTFAGSVDPDRWSWCHWRSGLEDFDNLDFKTYSTVNNHHDESCCEDNFNFEHVTVS